LTGWAPPAALERAGRSKNSAIGLGWPNADIDDHPRQRDKWAMTPSIPSFHDGHLTGVALKDKVAVVSLLRSDGGEYELTLSGLKALQVADFREGNIVARVEVISGREPDPTAKNEIMERLFPGPHPNAAQSYHAGYAAFIEARLAELASGAATIVAISPSYGADLLAFCETFQMRSVAV
jgi:hypothetical protein